MALPLDEQTASLLLQFISVPTKKHANAQDSSTTFATHPCVFATAIAMKTVSESVTRVTQVVAL